MELKDDLLDFVYPQHCAICKKYLRREEKDVCEVCWNSLETLTDPFCPYCKSFIEEADTECSFCKSRGKISIENHTKGGEDHKILIVRSLGRFDEYYKELIHRFKYGKKIPLGKRLGQRLGETIDDDSIFLKSDFLIPVPLHKSRYRERGFNQSDILAEGISKATGLSVLKSVLKRKKNTKDQTNLSREQREENVRDAFVVSCPKMIKGKKVILVDDVITTGVTLSECARMLKQAGAEKILGMTIAVVTD
ncbi:MAG: ComF family protein [candidate division Zixibacteria bacterium]|nr:ComF family protein [candidate division Zixibacteria bacterium]